MHGRRMAAAQRSSGEAARAAQVMRDFADADGGPRFSCSIDSVCAAQHKRRHRARTRNNASPNVSS
jgi:hypothetical protein